jgi:serine/threonine protein kinase
MLVPVKPSSSKNSQVPDRMTIDYDEDVVAVARLVGAPNLFVATDVDFEPRLCDFGQSRLSDEQDPALGTLFYMAPEQADLKAVPDARWDVYALGALLYQMLCGEVPYRTRENEELIRSAGTLEERLACTAESVRLADGLDDPLARFHAPPHEFAARVAELAPDVDVRILAPGGALEL